MADRIITSEKAEQLLRKLSYSTGIEIATIARLALSLSIRYYNFEELSLNDTRGREIRRYSLFGQDELLYKSILCVLLSLLRPLPLCLWLCLEETLDLYKQ